MSKVKFIQRVEIQPSTTAIEVAYIRALASKENKGTIWGSDYLAEIFLTPEHIDNLKSPNIRQKDIEERQRRGTYGLILARHTYFDHVFKQDLKNNTPQIVLLGAGYDTRAYRFQEFIKKSKIFELDIHTTQQRKKECLFEAGIRLPKQVLLIPINFNVDSLKNVLFNAGFDENKKSLFIWVGVTYYLSPDAVDTTLEFIKLNTPPLSRITFDYMHISSKSMTGYGVMELIKHMKSNRPGEPTRFRVKQGKIELFLSDRGFEIIEHYTSKELEDKFLTLSDGSLIARIPPIFFIVHAVVK